MFVIHLVHCFWTSVQCLTLDISLPSVVLLLFDSSLGKQFWVSPGCLCTKNVVVPTSISKFRIFFIASSSNSITLSRTSDCYLALKVPILLTFAWAHTPPHKWLLSIAYRDFPALLLLLQWDTLQQCVPALWANIKNSLTSCETKKALRKARQQGFRASVLLSVDTSTKWKIG